MDEDEGETRAHPHLRSACYAAASVSSPSMNVRPSMTSGINLNRLKSHQSAPGLLCFQSQLPYHREGRRSRTASLRPFGPQAYRSVRRLDRLEPVSGLRRGGTLPCARVPARAGDGARRRRGQQPFLLCVSYHHPHEPFRPTQQLWDRYQGADNEIPDLPRDLAAHDSAMDRWLHALHGTDRIEITAPDSLRALRRPYYALVSYIDDKVGELLAAVDAVGLSGDTVVLHGARCTLQVRTDPQRAAATVRPGGGSGGNGATWRMTPARVRRLSGCALPCWTVSTLMPLRRSCAAASPGAR